MVSSLADYSDPVRVSALLINGEAQNFQALHELLAAQGCRVIFNPDVKEGIRRIQVDPPNLILLCTKVPTKECYDLCRRLTSQLSNVPVVFLSSSGKTSHKTRAYAAGAADYWKRPFEPEEILRRMTTLVAYQRACQENSRLQSELALFRSNDEPTRAIDSEDAAESYRGFLRRYSLAEVLDSIDDVVLVLSADTQEILYVNRAVNRLYGYQVAEFIQTPSLWRRVIHPDDLEPVNLAIRSLVGGRKLDIQYRIIRQNGELRYVRTRLWGVYGEAGSLIRVDGLIGDITTFRTRELQLAQQALHDGLTQVANRTLFLQRLEEALNRAKRISNYRFAVLFIDLNQFKRVNDTFGHLIGDQLLVHVASTLKDCIRSIDMVARLGGDEFLIFLDSIQDREYVVGVTERILDALAQPAAVDRYMFSVNASIGIAIADAKYQQTEHLIRDADIAMYRSKEKGEGAFEFFFDISIESSAPLHASKNSEDGISHLIDTREHWCTV
ncbi:hypothetical protein C7271_01725 [filamentous cyanobacterium CCP5]|nr:hypothetical protein C7271_01725 [filamentous cyanobacterium CCP5]